ncbi:ATP-binding cassette domain-containing protein [Candidatus Woesearchaeota archaeon]|nr:ATP-binding cassette domain-containing protein [Candidatus Woesearchaeota archaeon]
MSPFRKNIIEVENLSKYFGNLKAVDNISFKVEKGSVFAFLGPNGAGKSTTIKMLTTLTKPSSGRINIDGVNCLENKSEIRKRFGIVFQDQSLDDELTAYENLNFHAAIYNVPKKLREQRIKFALNLVELSQRKNDFVKTFSGGMKRRLEIARGLIHHPLILFLDEPTLGLDPQTRNKIWEHIEELNQKENMTIFFTTHYMPEAEQMADKIAIIDYGKIIAQGTLAQLKKNTKSTSLEDSFLNLTGRSLREENATSIDRMRMRRRVFRR